MNRNEKYKKKKNEVDKAIKVSCLNDEHKISSKISLL